MHGSQSGAILQWINRRRFLSENKNDALLKELNSEESAAIFSRYGACRNRVYTPLRTLCTFIRQVLSSDNTCQHAVSGVIAGHSWGKRRPPSPDTGAYVKARKRLSGGLINELMHSVSRSAAEAVPNGWKSDGRDIKVFDGTTITLADTPANNKTYPRHSNRKSDVGFPMVRLMVVLSLITGCVINHAYDACKGKGTGEISLLYRILDCINDRDIILADRYFCNFFLFCDLQKKQVDILTPGHVQRRYDFRRGIRLGKKDHVVSWKKPRKPDWMSRKSYQQYPDVIQIRELQIQGMVYITTFLDAKTHSKHDLQGLYKKRWGVELHLNSIKTVMKMNRLACKTPDMVAKEISVHLLAYNIIRKLMVIASARYQTLPWNVSFKASLQLLNQFLLPLALAPVEEKTLLYERLLQTIVKNKTGNRPGRVEPRLVRQKTRSFPILRNTRKAEQQKLLKQRKLKMYIDETA